MSEIRWQQRLQSYLKALVRLKANILFAKNALPEIDFNDRQLLQNCIDYIPDIYKQGLIQSFEFTHELAWNVMKDFAEDQGFTNIRGSKDATRQAAQMGLIEDPETWMLMIPNRNKSTHTYAEELANLLFTDIIFDYTPVFQKFAEQITAIQDGNP